VYFSIKIMIPHRTANGNRRRSMIRVLNRRSSVCARSINEHVLVFSTTPLAANVHRRVKACPICGEKKFSRLSHHLTVVHNISPDDLPTVLAQLESNPISFDTSMMPTVGTSSPKTVSVHQLDSSPQPTPININTNNQQITSALSPPSSLVDPETNAVVIPNLSPNEQQTTNYTSIDGKKRLLCPCCDTWVLNLTDHLIKKHHLLSKQERLPFLRMARNRQTPGNGLITLSTEQQQQALNNHKYQNIMKKYRKKITSPTQAASSSTCPNGSVSIASHDALSNTNVPSSNPRQTNTIKTTNNGKDLSHVSEEVACVLR
jgi:hypothetical protein